MEATSRSSFGMMFWYVMCGTLYAVSCYLFFFGVCQSDLAMVTSASCLASASSQVFRRNYYRSNTTKTEVGNLITIGETIFMLDSQSWTSVNDTIHVCSDVLL